MIGQGIPQGERLVRLNQIAITQLTALTDNASVRKLKDMSSNTPKLSE